MSDARDQIIGKHVWYRSAFCNINEGTAEAKVGKNAVRIRHIGADGPTHYRQVIKAEDIFLTKEDLMGANYERYLEQIKAYKDEMPDICSLVQFLFDHAVGKGTENVDDIARTAARQRAMELLHIEVDKEVKAEEEELMRIMNED